MTRLSQIASVSVQDVRDVLHLDFSDISDVQTAKMIKRASTILSSELSEDINHLGCSELQKEAIVLLASIYAVCFLTGGTAIGLNFSVGDVSSSQSALPSLTVLQTEFERILHSLKEPYVGSV